MPTQFGSAVWTWLAPAQAAGREGRPEDLACLIRDPLRAVRRPPDPFSLMDVPLDGACPSEESLAIARSLAVSVDGVPIDERFVSPLAFVPVGNLRAFKLRGGEIAFARSYLEAIDSDYGNERRGYPLNEAALAMYRRFDQPRPPVYGLFDPPMDALIFSNAVTPVNHERVVLHEFGHAMTVALAHVAHLRSDLLVGLPEQINEFLRGYPPGNHSDEIRVRVRVLEALAEAYVWALVGRFSELPPRLHSIVHGVLSSDGLNMSA